MDAAGPIVARSTALVGFPVQKKGRGMRRCFCAAFAALALLAPVGAARAATRAKIRQELASVVAKLSSFGVPGGVIGVTGGPVGRYRAVFGVASPGVPMSLDDRFRLGCRWSCSAASGS